jgi:hypothetical protein
LHDLNRFETNHAKSVEGHPRRSQARLARLSSAATGAWNFFKVDADPANVNWADFPKLGLNRNWIVVTANMLSGADPEGDGGHTAAAATPEIGAARQESKQVQHAPTSCSMARRAEGVSSHDGLSCTR